MTPDQAICMGMSRRSRLIILGSCVVAMGAAGVMRGLITDDARLTISGLFACAVVASTSTPQVRALLTRAALERASERTDHVLVFILGLGVAQAALALIATATRHDWGTP